MKSVYFKDQHGRIIEVRVADKWGQYSRSDMGFTLDLLKDGSARFTLDVNEEGKELPYAFDLPNTDPRLLPQKGLPKSITAESQPGSKNKLELQRKRPEWYRHDAPCTDDIAYGPMFETQLWELNLTDPYRIITWE